MLCSPNGIGEALGKQLTASCPAHHPHQHSVWKPFDHRSSIVTLCAHSARNDRHSLKSSSQRKMHDFANSNVGLETVSSKPKPFTQFSTRTISFQARNTVMSKSARSGTSSLGHSRSTPTTSTIFKPVTMTSGWRHIPGRERHGRRSLSG